MTDSVSPRRQSSRRSLAKSSYVDLTLSDEETVPLGDSDKHNKRKRQPAPSEHDSDSDVSVPQLGEEEYEIDYIVDSRFETYRGKTVLEYRVHWKGYGIKDRTWTLADQLEDSDPPVVAFYKKYPKKPRAGQRTVFDVLMPTAKAATSRNSPVTKKATPAPKPIRASPQARAPTIPKRTTVEDDSDGDFVEDADEKSVSSLNGNGDDESAGVQTESEADDDEPEAPKAAKAKTIQAKKFTGGWGANRAKGPKKAVISLGNFKPPVINKAVGSASGFAKDMAVHLPPITDIDAMFDDLTSRIPSVTKVVEKLNGRKLRVATMCSGTESPLLALNMIAKAINAQHGAKLEFDHVFSCEIEPFKQAYIERNFSPPILFRDVTELGRKKAHTAYGSLVEVPGNVDILIAGTSCVDYSGLNNEKQTIEGNGESGRTFRGMLQWVKKHQPPIVILENVCSAPWDKVIEYFAEIDYDAQYARLDTKEFYIPHTRTRIYLFATPYGAKKDHLPEKWVATVKDLRRPWSAPFEAFLLPTDNPYIHRARLDLAAAKLHRDGTQRKPTDWGRCESRHARARLDEELGILRPLTSWKEAGVCKGLDWTWNDWLQSQTERVVDLLDISTLRMAKDGIDAGYKACIWNVSQNVDRQTGSSKTALAPCLTPNMIPWVTNRGGPVIGREALALQGIPVRELLLTSENEDQLADLAGNAMTTTVVGATMLAALCLAVDRLSEGDDAMADSMQSQDVESKEASKVATRIVGEQNLTPHALDLAQVESADLAQLIKDAVRSSRHCECEGQSDISTAPISHCSACGYRSCKTCGGRPDHEYEPYEDQRLGPVDFEERVKGMLPMRVNLAGINEESLSQVRELASDLGKGTVRSSDWDMWSNAILSAVTDAEFRFRYLKRQTIWTAVYEAPTATLELCICQPTPEWRLSIKAPQHEPVSSRLRELLRHPAARMKLDMRKRDVLSGKWELCVPSYQTFPAQISGCGDIVPSWQAALGLQGGREGGTRWSQIEIELSEAAEMALDRSLSGVYTLLPKCGQAQASLHIKESDDNSVPPLFLFLDPSRCGEASDDQYVFSPSIERLDYYTERDVVATFDKKWRESSKSKETVNLEVRGGWAVCKKAHLTAVGGKDIAVDVSTSTGDRATYAVSTDADVVSKSTSDCHQSAALLSVKVPLDASHAEAMWKKNAWGEVDLEHQGIGTFAQLAWITERLPSLEQFSSWNLLSDAEHAGTGCTSCAPLRPTIHWIKQLGKLNKNGNKTRSTIEPYEDRLEAGRYEQALKRRPAPFVVQLRLDDNVGNFRIGLNMLSLAHRALSRLPTNTAKGSVKLSWRLTANRVAEVPQPPRVYIMPSNKLDPQHPQPQGFKYPLRKEQLRSLWWMLQQERAKGKTHTFVEEEISESSLPGLGWRAEGKAERPVMIRGGVIADQVGYGKTIISLALIAETNGERAPVAEPCGLIDTKATLIVVPGHLSKQWPSEIRKFTGKMFKTIVIQNMNDLNNISIGDIQKADIVVMAADMFGSESYWQRVEYLSAQPKDWLSDGNGGRFFSDRLDTALTSMRSLTECLKGSGAAEAQDLMVETQKQVVQDAESKRDELKAANFGKRLKGAAYRDKYDASATRPAKKSKTSKGSDKAWEVDEDEDEDEEEEIELDSAKPSFHKASGTLSLSSSTVQKDFQYMTCPVVHMFRFRRVIADEFTYLEKRGLAGVLRLSSCYKWILSGTPPVNDFPAIRGIATFMGIHLGVEDEADGGPKKSRAGKDEVTKAEKFHAFRETHSAAWHRRRQDLAQEFLDDFVRQNIAEIEDIPTVEHIHTIRLPASEAAVYLELEHHLQALDMQARKETKFKNVSQGDRNARLEQALADSRTAEEALLKRCTHFTLDLHNKALDAKTALEACQHITTARKRQLEGCEEDLQKTINHAVGLHAWIRKKHGFGGKDERKPFSEWVEFSVDPTKHHGDAEAAQRLVKVLIKCGFVAGVIPTGPADNKLPKIEAKAAVEDIKWQLREQTHLLRRLSKELVARVRSLRFFDVVRRLQHSGDERYAVLEKSECGHRPSGNSNVDMAVLSCCGHVACYPCMMEAVNSQRCVKGELCHAAVRETNVVRVDSLGIEGELSSGRFGAKLQRLVDLVKTIPKSERILVFVQYEDLYPKVEEALGSARIEYATLQGSVKKRANTLDNFQSEEDGARLLLLKMNDASAAGSNLTTANHAIFLGPLCVPSLLEYRAVETQAIGRVRRFGQSRTVHVHRLFALDTIDMRIYESRSAELCAKPDYVELPKEEYVPRRKALHRRVSDDDVEMVLVE